MPVSMRLDAVFLLRESDTLEKALEPLRERARKDQVFCYYGMNEETLEDGNLRVEFSADGEMSYGTSEDLESDLKELEDHVVRGTWVRYTCDGEEGGFAVGPLADAQVERSALRLEEIKERLQYLTLEDATQLEHQLKTWVLPLLSGQLNIPREKAYDAP